MPRCSRLVLAHTAHHVVARGTNKKRLFRHGFDKDRYLTRFAKVAAEENVLIHGYCLMDNHVHWILTPSTGDGLARLFRRVHTAWAMWFNRQTGQSGHLFQGRFHSSPLSENHYWTALRYVELNPRRAGLVERADEWKHSSARAHLNPLDPTLAHCPITLAAVEGRRDLLHQGWREYLDIPDPDTTHALRRAQPASLPFGPEPWIRDLEQQHQRKLLWAPPGRPKKTHAATAQS